jgi:hypothetical protein
MAKSNRRRRQAKAKRHSAAAKQRQAAARERAREEEIIREAEGRLSLLRDPATPIEDLAVMIRDQFGSGPIMPGFAMLLAEYRGSADELSALAEALDGVDAPDRAGASLLAATFRAEVAYLTGDYPLAHKLIDEALARAEDAETRVSLAEHLRVLGRTADSIELLARHITDPAYGSIGAAAHGRALEDAQRHLTTEPPPGHCPCGSGGSWTRCCRLGEAGAIERFQGRSGLYALRTAITEFLPGSPYEDPVAEHVAEWLDTADTDAWEQPKDLEPLKRLAIEHAWLLAGQSTDKDDDLDNVLTAVASDPSTDPEQAARAQAWRDHVRYGLWQVADPTSAPGLLCVELCTGQELYIAFAPEQTENLPRWCVLLGAVVPIDGAWRTTGVGLQASPSEADALCETVLAAAEVVTDELSGRPNKRAAERLRRPPPFGHAEPHNVYAYSEQPADSNVAQLISRVIGSLVPRLAAELQIARATPPTLTNTDGDPMDLIKAEVAVRDASRVVEQLTAHADFDADPEEPGKLTWLGHEIPVAQRKAMLAEARAQLRSQGYRDEDLDLSRGPKRWVRSQLQRHNSQITVDVNSRERLVALLAILDKIGAEPRIVDESHLDPAQDLPWSPAHLPLQGGIAPAQGGLGAAMARRTGACPARPYASTSGQHGGMAAVRRAAPPVRVRRRSANSPRQARP